MINFYFWWLNKNVNTKMMMDRKKSYTFLWHRTMMNWRFSSYIYEYHLRLHQTLFEIEKLCKFSGGFFSKRFILISRMCLQQQHDSLVKWNRLALPKWIKSRSFCYGILICFSQTRRVVVVVVVPNWGNIAKVY